MLILGIDPGMAHLGIARISVDTQGERVTDALDVVITAKGQGNGVNDGLERAKYIWDRIWTYAAHIDALAFEDYQPFRGRAKDGYKVAKICGAVMAIGFSLEVPVFAVTPNQLKKAVVGRPRANKDDVQNMLRAQLSGFSDKINTFTKSNREHASDAAAVACVGLALLKARS